MKLCGIQLGKSKIKMKYQGRKTCAFSRSLIRKVLRNSVGHKQCSEIFYNTMCVGSMFSLLKSFDNSLRTARFKKGINILNKGAAPLHHI